MEREIDLKEVSDGKLYTAGDMVKIGCNDCAGCSECCRTVGDTIILDPYDLYQLEQVLHTGFEELMIDKIELRMVDGVVQPNLKIRENGKGCVLLSDEGRCTIHQHRPGFCRMFPMGRIYEGETFRYFVQVHECPYPGKTKVKLKKWLGIPELPRYEEYIKTWHFFLKQVQEIIRGMENQEMIKSFTMYLLNQFYVNQYDIKVDFYSQFEERMEHAKEVAAAYR